MRALVFSCGWLGMRWVGLLCLLAISSVSAESLVDQAMREVEEFRLTQLAVAQSNGELAPFSTDGCSGNLSASWALLAKQIPQMKVELGEKPPWEDCCVAHDRAYWRGEVEDGFNLRLVADRQLRQCVVDTGARLAPDWSSRFSLSEAQVEQGFSVTAELMFQAVRLGGQPCSLLPWRWGYGWPGCALEIP